VFDIHPDIFLKAALCFLRVGAIMFALPLFGDSSVPLRARLITVIAVSICIFPTLGISWAPAFTDDVWSLSGIIIKEILIGLTIGFVAKLFFEGVIMASSLVGYQMGFGTANLMVPDAKMQMSSFTAFHRIIIIMIFFSFNLHHLFLMAISDTFSMIPAGAAHPNQGLATLVIEGTASIFSVAMQLAAPILVALLFTMASLGLIARTVPQMNVFTMSFPISFFVGLSIYVATTPYLGQWLRNHFMRSSEYMYLAIKGLM
jgi:flagellar biosynthetic protein FliR